MLGINQSLFLDSLAFWKENFQVFVAEVDNSPLMPGRTNLPLRIRALPTSHTEDEREEPELGHLLTNYSY